VIRKAHTRHFVIVVSKPTAVICKTNTNKNKRLPSEPSVSTDPNQACKYHRGHLELTEDMLACLFYTVYKEGYHTQIGSLSHQIASQIAGGVPHREGYLVILCCLNSVKEQNDAQIQ